MWWRVLFSVSWILKVCSSQDLGGMFKEEVVVRFALSKQGSVVCTAGKGGHTKEELLIWSGMEESQLAASAGQVSRGIPQIMLDFPMRAEAQLFCPELKRLPGNSLSFNCILSAFSVAVQKEGAGLYYFYLGCPFPVNEPQTFQILHMHISEMYLAAAHRLQNSTDTFRYPRSLVSRRAGWPLLLRSRDGKSNSYCRSIAGLSTQHSLKHFQAADQSQQACLASASHRILHICAAQALFWWQVQSNKSLRSFSCHLFVLNHIMNTGDARAISGKTVTTLFSPFCLCCPSREPVPRRHHPRSGP